ncbi:DUF928 domain-containing protein [Myxosarcina sp. GI1]|uniref:DUF928 domain-containing protein n=1 Tax=Myxosarcina sp. GI1 TaxID=1541065 RepID=UPI00068A906E|nr:DUF928 domain-containing protein [Myxosarcina sp. GI1]
MLNIISKTKKNSNKLGGALGLLVIFSYLLAFSQPANAEKASNSSSLERENQGLPIQRRDGGSRSGKLSRCVDSSSNLIALVPEARVASTNSNSPSLFFYIPETTEPKTIEFVLRNEADRLIYEDFITTTGKGIVEVNIPSRILASSVNTEQNYHWYLSLICNPQYRSRDLVVEGWMRQEQLDSATLERLSNTSNTVEKAEIYHQQGFWYDALSMLAKHKVSSTDESAVATKWLNLLQSVNLEELASEPIVESISIKDFANNRSQAELMP